MSLWVLGKFLIHVQCPVGKSWSKNSNVRRTTCVEKNKRGTYLRLQAQQIHMGVYARSRHETPFNRKQDQWSQESGDEVIRQWANKHGAKVSTSVTCSVEALAHAEVFLVRPLFVASFSPGAHHALRYEVLLTVRSICQFYLFVPYLSLYFCMSATRISAWG